MSELHPLSTGEVVSIALKAVAKQVPLAGQFIEAHEQVFAAIEANRIKAVVEQVVAQLDALAKKTNTTWVIDNRAVEVLVYGCEQARTDPNVSSKTKIYGGVIGHYIGNAIGMEAVVEVLELLRKINATDLKLLYALRDGATTFNMRRVDEMIGYSPYLEPFKNEKLLGQMMADTLPSIKRLEGLGVIYLSDEHVGGIVHDAGPLSNYLMMWANLTPAGKRLVLALPG